MANLLSICETAWLQLYPTATDEAPITKEEFIETGLGEYAYQFLLWYWKEKGTEGVFNIPGNLSSEHEFDVIDNEIDISGLDIMSRLPNDLWLQNIGGLTTDCNYVKSNINQTQLLKEDDSLPDDYKTYLIVGKKIKFPQGTHKTPISIIVANSGKEIDGDIEIDDAIGAIVRTRLIEIYGNRIGLQDKTNNSSGQS